MLLIAIVVASNLYIYMGLDETLKKRRSAFNRTDTTQTHTIAKLGLSSTKPLLLYNDWHRAFPEDMLLKARQRKQARPICGEDIPFVSFKNKAIVCTAPKAASSQWRRLLKCAQEDDPFSNSLLPDFSCQSPKFADGCAYPGSKTHCHALSQILRISDLNGTQIEGIWPASITPTGFNRIAIVRNPMFRLISAFTTGLSQSYFKNIGVINDGKQPFQIFLQHHVLSSTIAVDANGCPPASLNHNEQSQHWYPQHCRCGFERGVAWNIVKIEEPAAMVQAAASLKQVPQKCKHHVTADGPRHMSTSRLKALCRYYGNLEVFDKIAKKREEEILQLNYTAEVQQMRAWMISHCIKAENHGAAEGDGVYLHQRPDCNGPSQFIPATSSEQRCENCFDKCKNHWWDGVRMHSTSKVRTSVKVIDWGSLRVVGKGYISLYSECHGNFEYKAESDMHRFDSSQTCVSLMGAISHLKFHTGQL